MQHSNHQNRRLLAGAASSVASSEQPTSDIFTLKDFYSDEEIVKKSRFITHVAPIQNQEEFDDFLEEIRDDTASHNCWAWKVGNEYRFSDDGEPSGTAGKPIFQAIEYSGLDNVAVVVTRFFGGIKLGAGGLVRAYGGSASSCLRKAPRVKMVAMSLVEVSCSASFIGIIYRILQGRLDLKTDYCEDGSVKVSARVPEGDAEIISKKVESATQARATVGITASFPSAEEPE